MRILYFNTPVYDFLAATIIEGLNELSAETRVELVTREKSNYARPAQVWNRRQIYRERKSFDVVVLGTNVGVDEELFWEVSTPENRVCIDGTDESGVAEDPAKFRVYFKRELHRSSDSNVRPCPIAVERRWMQRLRNAPAYFLSACFTARPGPRAEALDYLRRLRVPDSYVGAVPMGRGARLRGLWLGQCTWRATRINSFAVGHNSAYYRILNDSLLSLTVPGVGQDTGRWWEILGAGAVHLARATHLPMPHPFVPMEHFLEYDSPDQLAEILGWARKERGQLDRMRRRAREYCLAHHTTKARARYVVSTVRQALQS